MKYKASEHTFLGPKFENVQLALFIQMTVICNFYAYVWCGYTYSLGSK